ncbi:hypothetical protein EI165_08715 [Pseudoalteromonas nigrifaciens]|uniref:DUF7014 domain-containing protein n=2 Tax=Pseudoalteromonas nigrifaciens TaxID=28109 RepID=UPI00178861CF|nr:hypothetical protein [Pseudoalteromonas nigrifaciens]MBE0420205.1 hypothetical protein [Pseudoalteromonas nigrifaciens]
MLGNIFDVFSRRENTNDKKIKPITETFRNRYLMILKEFFSNNTFTALGEMHKKLCFLHGKNQLIANAYQGMTPADDVVNFIMTCEDDHLLDVIEYTFLVMTFQERHKEDGLISQINEFFTIDKLSFYITKTVWEEVETSFHGTPTTGKQIREFPKVIRKDSDLVHENAIEPALILLRKPDLLNANEEFMLALQDYRKGDYKDSVSKCCSALESVMKVICKRRGFSYTEKQTAAPLLNTIVTNSGLDSFWEQPLILIATIRNRLSYSHGAGNETKDVPEHVAKYSINSTASAILLLCDEAYE